MIHDVRSSPLTSPFNPQLLPAIFNEFDYLKNPRNLQRRLAAILADPVALSQVASRSYRHSNGFDKIVLKYYDRRYPCIRLHVWGPMQSRSCPDIHNHPWNFAAHVIAGSLTNQVFTRIQSQQNDGNNVCALEYTVTAGNPTLVGHRTSYVGEAWLAQQTDCLVSRHSTYGFSTAVLHRTLPAAQSGAATLFLQGPFLLTESSMFRSSRADYQQGVIRVDVFSPAELRERLKAWDFLWH